MQNRPKTGQPTSRLVLLSILIGALRAGFQIHEVRRDTTRTKPGVKSHFRAPNCETATARKVSLSNHEIFEIHQRTDSFVCFGWSISKRYWLENLLMMSFYMRIMGRG